MLKFESKKNKIIFFIILLVAGFLRLVYLSEGMVFVDEAAYSVRSSGWFDSLGTNMQKTPIDVFAGEKWWTGISFHDHPPLVFAINHVFIRLFGDSLFVTRLPSALFGILTAGLIFLIGRLVFKREDLSLITMALYAVSVFAIAFSRVGMLESISLFFILMSLYVFLLCLEKPKKLPWLGLIVGLSVLCKYTALVLLPVFLFVIIVYRREWFKDTRLYLAGAIFLITLLPIFIYNYQLYIALGHFDVQFASLFKQPVTEWQSLLGKQQIGSLVNRFQNWILLGVVLTPLSIWLIFFGGILFITKFKLKIAEMDKEFKIVISCFFVFLLATLVYGASFRFLLFTLPFLIVIQVYFLKDLIKFDNKKIIYVLVFVFLFEIFFSINSLLVPLKHRPIGMNYITYTDVFFKNDTGAKQLDQYFAEELNDYQPGLVQNYLKKDLNFVGEKTLEDGYKNIIIVYDTRLEYISVLAVLHKRLFYQGWSNFSLPVYYSSVMKKLLVNPLSKDVTIYYISALDKLAQDKNQIILNADPEKLEGLLSDDVVSSTLIYNNMNVATTKVYKMDVIDFNNKVLLVTTSAKMLGE